MSAAATIAPLAPPRPRRDVAAHLQFRRAGETTILAGQRTPHPFHITRPFHLGQGDPAGMATLYLQSSSGGLYGDDALSLEIAVQAGAAAHVTTQASTVVHHARGGETRQHTRLSVADGALLEYCPDPQILFAGAKLRADITAQLAQGARLMLTDAALHHDPAGDGQPFAAFANTIQINGADGAPLLIERSMIDGADWSTLTAGLPCHGAVFCVAASADEATALSDAMTSALSALGAATGAALYAGVTGFPDRRLAIARFLAADGAALSTALETSWRAARMAVTGAAPPRRPK